MPTSITLSCILGITGNFIFEAEIRLWSDLSAKTSSFKLDSLLLGLVFLELR